MEGFKRKAFLTSDVKSERIPHEMIEKYITKPKEITEMIKSHIATQRKLKISPMQEAEKTSPEKIIQKRTVSQTVFLYFFKFIKES